MRACIKETGADPGDLLRLEWTDINKKAETVTINHSGKGHNPRILSVSKEWIDRLNMLSKESEGILPITTQGMSNNFWIQRKRMAKKFSNPRLLKITFTTFRHWKATRIYRTP